MTVGPALGEPGAQATRQSPVGGPPRQSSADLGRRIAAEAQHIGRSALRTFVESLAAGATDDDRREQALYELVAALLAQDLNHPAVDIFRVVVELCGGPDHPLTARLPALDESLAATVRDRLLMIRVHYLMPRSGPHERTTEITVRSVGDQLRQRSVQHRLDWADLPGLVREQQIRTGRDEVIFQLYPRSS